MLPSKSSKILNAAASFPPPEVANFLIDIFFEYAQTNYSYVDEQSLRQNVECFFSHTRQPLDARDASWVCTVLMVFAIGTQFAHFCSRDGQIALSKSRNVVPESSSSPDDDIALTFYHAAVNLIPDVISLASIESVQAFLLLGVYSLPVNAAGLSFTYFGIAIKMAVQNGMHRNYSGGLEARTIELRNRIWWTTYILEKYISESPGEIKADQKTGGFVYCMGDLYPSQNQKWMPKSLQTSRHSERTTGLTTCLTFWQ